MKKRLLCVLLCLCILLCATPIAVSAANTLTGTVRLTSGSLNVRKEAPQGEIIGSLYNNDTVTILDTTVIDTVTWHKISKDKLVGWCSAQYIEINYTYENDADFEAFLTTQKFPEAYKEKLRLIHAQYPKWVFTAQHLSMTWAEALAAESKALKNAVTQPDSWKSMEQGAYNWTTGQYVAVDSGGWVTAAPAVIAHYMDPRNFLDADHVFQFEDLKYCADATLEGVQAILPGRFDGYAEDLLKASKDAQVNAYFLATRMTQEGSKVDGTVDGYKGYYNFFNIGAYAHSGNGAVTNGAIYAKNKGWNSPYACLLGSAQEINKGYISKGQNTLYYQKFNVAGQNLYNHQYMSNVQAPYSESAIRSRGAIDADKDRQLTFIIPVYKDMPEEVAPLPGIAGNNNNFLDSLTVQGCTVGPTFDRYTMNYTGSVEEGVANVTITAVPNAEGVKVEGAGVVPIKAGDNVIPITVTATSGQVRTYTITIVAPGVPADAPLVSGTVYQLSDTVTGVAPNTKIEDFIKTLGIENGSATVSNTAGEQKAEGIAATGDILVLHDSNNNLYKSYPIIVRGDVNGDGKVSPLDLTIVRKDILNITKTTGYFQTAGDVNGDGKLSPLDLTIARKFILNMTDSL